MIIVELTGGLGNQMFQYACGRRLSLKLGAELKTFFVPTSKRSRRKYELDCFNVVSTPALEEDVRSYYPKNRYLRFFVRNIFKPKNFIKQKGFHFESSILEQRDGVYLCGYWQSEKYFEDVEEQIRKDFIFKESPDSKNKELLNEIKKTNSFSVHVRRQDYVRALSASKMHGFVGEDYYQKAVVYIKSTTKNPTFFVFSDDIEWCKNNLRLNGPTHFVDFNKGDKSYKDLRLMSECKNDIIANSSFSWWGAWLNRSDKKMVIAPKIWFRDKNLNTKDLIPKDWKLI